jgi:hypothetical protein
MSNMNPDAAAIFVELEANPEQACIVNFAGMGTHAHLSSNGHGGFHLEMHTTVESWEEQEEVISVEHNLTAEEADFKLTMLSMLDNALMEAMVAESRIGDDAEDFLRQLSGE